MIYDLPKTKVEFTEEERKRYIDYKILKITAPSLIKSGFKENDSNVGYVFLPLKTNFDRLVILLHGMGGRNAKHLEYFGIRFAKAGIPLLMPILPFHYERGIKGMKDGEKFLTDDIEDSIRDYRQAILDIRALMDYLETKGFGKKGFTLVGFSFGGIIGTILMGINRRIRNGMLVVTGGDHEYIVWKSLATKLIRKKYKTQTGYESYGCTYEKCKEIHKDFPDILRFIKSVEDMEKIEFKKRCFLFDPLTFAPLIKGRKVILVRALFDEIFPKESTFALRDAIGDAKLVNLVSDHYLIILYKRLLFKYAYNLVTED